MGACLQFQASLVSETCIECGIEFAIPSGYRRQRLEDHRGFHCPNGHSQFFAGETEAQKLQKQLDIEKRKLEFERNQRATLEAQLSAAVKKTKRLTHRVECGVCPHCQRTFKQLAAHMKSKHSAAK